MTLNPQELLPIGMEIPMSDNLKLKITNLITDRGATALVYKGLLYSSAEAGSGHKEVGVAVKAFRPFTKVANIEREAAVLREMMELEPSISPKLNLSDVKMTPRYYGMGKYAEIDFIVMEFIEAPGLLDLALNRKLPKVEAISAIWQFCAFLEIIHGQNKYLKDFKSDNLYWHQQKRLRILDLGDVVEIGENPAGPGKLEYDLLKTSILLFKLITGYGIKYSINRLNERVEPLLTQYPLDWGMTRFMRRCLGQKADLRYKKAGEMREGLQLLAGYWMMSDDELFNKAMGTISELVSSTDKGRSLEAEHARAMLGVVEYRNQEPDDKITNAIEQAEKLFQKSGHLASGKRFLKEGDYEQAKQRFQQDISLSDTPAVLHRWIWAAEIGLELGQPAEFEKNSSDLEKMIDRMEKNRFPEAILIFESLSPDLKKMKKTKGAAALEAECRYWINIGDGSALERDHDYKGARGKYEEAITFKKILLNSGVISDELDDLDEKISYMNYLARTAGEAVQKIKAGKVQLQTEAVSTALANYQAAVDLAPEDVDVLAGLISGIDDCLKKGRIVEAGCLVDMGVSGLKMDQKLLIRRELVWKFSRANWYLGQLKVSDFVNDLKAIYGAYNHDQQLTTNVIQPAVVLLANQAETTLMAAELPGYLFLLIDLFRLLEGNNSPKAYSIVNNIKGLTKTTLETWGRTADRLIVEAVALINSDPPSIVHEDGFSKARLQAYQQKRLGVLRAAMEKLQDALRLSTDFKDKSAEIAKQIQQTDELISAVKNDKDSLLSIVDEKFADLRDRKLDLDLMDAWLDSRKFEKFARDLEAGLDNERIKRKAEFVAAVREYLNRVDPDNKEVLNMLESVTTSLDVIGKPAWQEVKSLAEEKIILEHRNLEGITADYDAGKLDDAAEIVTRLLARNPNNPELQKWDLKIKEAIKFKVWQDTEPKLKGGAMDQSILDLIWHYASMELPITLWHDGASARYLKVLYEACTARMKNLLKNPESFELLEEVRILFKVNSIMNQLPKGLGSNE